MTDETLRRARTVGGTALGGLLIVVGLLFALWPGPLALGDRAALALLFGVPGVAVLLRLQPALREVR